MTLSKILCKWKQDSVVSLFLYRKPPVKHLFQNRKISPDSVRFVQIHLRVGTNNINSEQICYPSYPQYVLRYCFKKFV